MPATKILHKGRQVIYADYSNCKTEEEMIKCVNEHVAAVKLTPGKCLVLVNIEGTNISTQFMDKVKKHGNTDFVGKIDKTAILGITGLKKVFLGAYNLAVKDKGIPFGTKEQALDYLVQ